MGESQERAINYDELIEQLEAEKEELQRTREETELLHHRFAELYEHAPVGYVVLTPKGLVLQSNATAREFVGADSLSNGRTALGPLVDREFQGEYYSVLRRAAKGDRAEAVSIRFPGPGGAPIWLQLRVVAVKNGDGELLEYRITLEDITERVAAQQEAEELLKRQKLLLREIHHRVKNDFHLIYSVLSLQLSTSEIPEVRSALDEARCRVTAMEQVYRNLHSQNQYSRVELSTLLREIAKGFEPGFDQSGVSLALDLNALEISTKTSVSTGLLLNELLTNATKYAIVGGADKITITLRVVDDGLFELAVTDNGPGLPEAVLDGSSRGFGLSVVGELVEQHGGSLSLANSGGAALTASMKID